MSYSKFCFSQTLQEKCVHYGVCDDQEPAGACGVSWAEMAGAPGAGWGGARGTEALGPQVGG